MFFCGINSFLGLVFFPQSPFKEDSPPCVRWENYPSGLDYESFEKLAKYYGISEKTIGDLKNLNPNYRTDKYREVLKAYVGV